MAAHRHGREERWASLPVQKVLYKSYANAEDYWQYQRTRLHRCVLIEYRRVEVCSADDVGAWDEIRMRNMAWRILLRKYFSRCCYFLTTRLYPYTSDDTVHNSSLFRIKKFVRSSFYIKKYLKIFSNIYKIVQVYFVEKRQIFVLKNDKNC